MKKIFFDQKKAKVQVENQDDLWYLSQLIDKGDELRGRTYRKIKLSGSAEKSKVEKKPVTLTISVEKTEFSDNVLKVNGKVLTPTEDIPKGSYQSITLEENSTVEITKEKWLKYQIDRLKDAFSTKLKGILIVVMDRETALFALTKRYGYDILAKLEGEVQKKEERAVAKGSFYEEIIKAVEQYTERYGLDNIIVASPAFWKEELLKRIKDNNLKKKIVVATCHSAEENAIKEVLRRDEIQTILKEERITKETALVEKLMEVISKDGKAAYGMDEVENAANAGAVEKLLITDTMINKSREEKNERLEAIMKTVDSLKGDIHIISSSHEAGKQLNGISGIAALLRYKP